MFDYRDSSVGGRWARTQGRMSGSISYGLTYPSPFFDVAHTYLPDTVKQMFRWCRYYYLTNPLIAATVNKMSEYPITELQVETENEGLADHWNDFFEETLRLRSFMLDIGLYYMCYGNSIISLYYPFIKFLKCKHCDHSLPVKKAKYRFHSFRFILDCPKCGNNGECDAEDTYIRSPSQVRLILWNPEDINIRHNPITGEDTFFYSIPKAIKNDIVMGKPETVETVPQLFIDAVKRQKAIILSPDNVFHFRKPSILTGAKDRGWGVPLLLPVLKDTFYLQILKKANEAIALERVYPLTVLFPQAGSGTSDPFSSISLVKWRDQVTQEIQRWRQDRAYIPIMPLPVGQQLIGGDGRALLLAQEIKIWSDQIIAGMGVPQEFVFGGLQWSGSNVSLRMLENHFLRYISDMLRFVKTFVIRNISTYLDWPEVPVRFKPFKMADDLQRKAYLFQLNQAGKLSDSALLSDADFDPVKEDEIINKEMSRRLESTKKQQLAQAEAQGEAQVVMAKYQAKAQTAQNQEMMQAQQGQQGAAPGEPREGMGQPGQAGQAGGQVGGQVGQPPALPQGGGQQQAAPQAQATPEMAQQIAQQLTSAPPEVQQQVLAQINEQNPQLAQMVASMLQQAPSPGGSAGAPLPEQLPPRRGAESAMI